MEINDENIKDLIKRYLEDTNELKGLKRTFLEGIDIKDWDVSKVTDMSYMFQDCNNFNSDLSNWNVSNVLNMSSMFQGCNNFNSDLSIWNVSSVLNMSFMFDGCKNFNSELSEWKVDKVTDMSCMFRGCTKFNSDLSIWNVSSVLNMSFMFVGCYKLDSDLNDWNVSNTTQINKMFGNNVSLLMKTNWYVKRFVNKYTMKELIRFVIQNSGYYYGNPSSYIILKENPNPFLIHYEKFEGENVPIISIPKGTILFTGRNNDVLPTNQSFSHLYKLHSNDTIEKYQKNDYENTMTYFFPYPYMIKYVLQTIKTIDMVVTTTDIRLLCLISPSGLTRADREFEDEVKVIKTCKSRNYDLCLPNKLLHELKINGYIGIAEADAVSTNFSSIEPQFEKNKMNLLDSILLNSCVFNCESDIFGTPEIVLIPYNIHKPNANENYVSVREQFNQYNYNEDTFIFKPYHQFVFNNAEVNIQEIDDYLFDNKTNICRSMQSYLLFYSLKNEVDASLLENGMMVPIENDNINNHSINELLFTKAYENNGNPPYFSAFENMNIYTKISKKEKTKYGGKIKNNEVLDNDFIDNTIFEKTSFTPKTTTPMVKQVNQNKMYYSERSGIPVFMFLKDETSPREKFGGKTRKYKRKYSKKIHSKRKRFHRKTNKRKL